MSYRRERVQGPRPSSFNGGRVSRPRGPDPSLGLDLRLSTLTDNIGIRSLTLEEKRYNRTMPNKRIITLLALSAAIPFLAWGQVPPQDPLTGSPLGSQAKPAPEPEAPPTPAELALDEAIAKIRARDAISSDVLVQVSILGHKFRVSGIYLKAPGLRSLLRLSVSGLGDSTGTMQQVCDGVTLWDYSQVMEQQTLELVRVGPVMELLQKPELEEDLRSQIETQLGLSGPEALLAGLRKVSRFDQIAEDTLDGRPVLVIGGSWKESEVAGLPGGQAAIDRFGMLPAYVPSIVRLWIGKDDGWPYKVALQGRMGSMMHDGPLLNAEGRIISRKAAATRQPQSSLTLFYTLNDKPVRDEDFLFAAPPTVNAQDLTERVTATLEAAMAEGAARKRAAGTGTGDLLDESIPAPAPEPAQPESVPAPDTGAPLGAPPKTE